MTQTWDTPEGAYEALCKDPGQATLSINRDRDGRFYLVEDGGARRNIACRTKRACHSKRIAKKKLKELRAAGRRELVMYECWYSGEQPHWHHGYPAGHATYRRSGRIYG